MINFAIITIIIRLISLIFILTTFYWVSNLKFISSTKIINNTKEAPFGMLNARTEPKNGMRVKQVVESDTVFLLEIYH